MIHFSLVPISQSEELNQKEFIFYDYRLKLETIKNSKGIYYFKASRYDENGAIFEEYTMSADEVFRNIENNIFEEL